MAGIRSESGLQVRNSAQNAFTPQFSVDLCYHKDRRNTTAMVLSSIEIRIISKNKYRFGNTCHANFQQHMNTVWYTLT